VSPGSTAVSAVLALCLTGPALAQGPPGRRQGAQGPNQPDRPREELFKMIDAYVVSNMQESLSLSDEQFVKLLPLVKRLQTDRRAFAERRMRALVELRRSFDSGSATDARVNELLKELKAVEAEEPPTLRKHLDAIDAALSPVQQAKYRILEVEVERRLRELMGQVRRRAGAAARGRPDGEPPQH
jgi:hypothetical protein